ncbi:hypothetical protein HBH97_254880, partial [Parastagonospora nodorum]
VDHPFDGKESTDEIIYCGFENRQISVLIVVQLRAQQFPGVLPDSPFLREDPIPKHRQCDFSPRT